jgi:membrane protein YqaA with SNARE-associated domain
VPSAIEPAGDRRERRIRALLLAGAGLWGFAEATLFFLVPDVLLSAIALRRPRLAWIACLVAVAGALPGGALMDRWGERDAPAARRALDRLPAISTAMIERVGRELEVSGAAALFVGPTRGTPYKIYAVESGARAMPLGRFLAVSVPARLLRFALVTALAAFCARRLFPRASPARLYAICLVAWTGFYSLYFALMPS